MRRFLLFASALLIAAAALMLANDAVNRYLIFSASNNNAYKMWRLVEGFPPGEIPILGSSRAEAGFAPRNLSPRAFNYGLSGSSFRETLFHLKCVLSRKEGGLVIVNLDPWGLGSGGFCGDYRFVAHAPLVRVEPKILIPFADRLPGLRAQGRFRRNVAECVNNRLGVTKTMEEGAILQRLSRTAEGWAYIISKCEPMKFRRDAETERLLSQLLSANTTHEIVFVVSPVSPPWWERFTGKAELKELEDWLASFPHVRVLDFAAPANGFGLDAFMDLTHLNEQGARRFTRLLHTKLPE